MYATFMKNRVCKSGNGFRCTLCDIEIVDKSNAYLHLTCDEKHLKQIETVSSLKYFKIDDQKSIEFVNNGIVPINNREFKCVFCSCSIPKLSHVPEHISGKKHLTKRRKLISDSDISDIIKSDIAEEQNKNKEELIPNDSVSDQNKTEEKSPTNDSAVLNIVPFYCNKCQSNLKSGSALLYHRMFHLSQKFINITDIISFSMKDYTKSIYCLICDRIMNSEEALEKHLKEVAHHKRLIILYCPNNGTIMNTTYLNCPLYPNIAISPHMNNIYNTLNSEFNRNLYYLGYNIYCNALQTTLPSGQVNNKFKEHQMLSKNNSMIEIHENKHITAYFCFMCNVKFVDENLLFLHYNYDNIHKYRMEAINLVLKDKHMKFATYSNNEVIKCLKCQVHLSELNRAVTHLFEIQHLMEQQDKNEINLTNNNIVVLNNNTSRNMYVCPVCKINLTHDYMMVQHLESDCHKNKVREYYANINCGSFEKIIFFCPFCNINFFNDITLLEHFYHNHQSIFKNIIQTNNAIFTNSAKMHPNVNNSYTNGAVNQGLLLNEMNYALQHLVKFNLNNDQQKLSENINKQNNKFISASLSNYTKKLINFSSRYVKLCIETGEENIFKIDPEGIRKLQLGISLTFPYKSNRGCIPCRYEISSDPQLLYEHLRTEEHEINLQNMEENDKYFENYRDQFSDLELAKSYMCEHSRKYVKCLTCDIKINNCDESLRSHINSESHIENYKPWKKSADDLFRLFNDIFENLWYYIEKFFCNICCVQFDFGVDYVRHLENPNHLKQVEKTICKKQSLQFDCCILCSSYWYAKSNHYTIHCSRNSHKYILKSRNFNVPEMTDLAKSLLTSVEETVDKLLIESCEENVLKQNNEKKLLESVEAIVKSKYPQAKAYLFGSRTYHISFLDSDLDIYLDCENQYKQLKSIDESQEQMAVVQECFYKHQDIWIIEEVIYNCRVPIIKLRHRFTNLNCDISFINGLSVEKSKILGYYIKACLPCKKLILYLKKWNTLCRLSGAKGITTFSTSWLVIFYLQIRKILPSVQYLIKLENNSNIVAGWETGISKIVPVEKIDDSLKELLYGFFSYYAEFNYISNVVCPFLGKIMKKSAFSKIDDLPEEMNNYKTQVKEEKVEYFRLDSPMCIQEPIDLSQNMAKAVTKLHLRMFKRYCSESAVSLKCQPKVFSNSS